MKKTLPEEEHDKIEQLLADCYLTVGLGTDKHKACSLAAINLALTGVLTDRAPTCMSVLISDWTIQIQDVMPHDIRNSKAWRALLPFAAGTAQSRETELKRVDVLVAWTRRLYSMLYDRIKDGRRTCCNGTETIGERLTYAAHPEYEQRMEAGFRLSIGFDGSEQFRPDVAIFGVDWTDDTTRIRRDDYQAWILDSEEVLEYRMHHLRDIYVPILEDVTRFPAGDRTNEECQAEVYAAWAEIDPVDILRQLITAGEEENEVSPA